MHKGLFDWGGGGGGRQGRGEAVDVRVLREGYLNIYSFF